MSETLIWLALAIAAAAALYLPWFVGAAIIGALVGTGWSVKGLNKTGVLRVRGVVLGIAAAALAI